jgi:hypothetical protein
LNSNQFAKVIQMLKSDKSTSSGYFPEAHTYEEAGDYEIKAKGFNHQGEVQDIILYRLFREFY